MVKKALLGVLLVGFSGVLIYGAILRTSSRTALTQVNAEDDRRNQQDAHDYDLEKLAEQRGSGGGREGGAGRGEGKNQAASQPLAEELPHDWIDQQGLVESIDSEAIAIRTTQGDLVLVEGRAWLFIREAGMQIVVDDEISLTGFYEDGEYKPSSISNHTTGESLTIRDQSGRPMWAGRRGEGL